MSDVEMFVLDAPAGDMPLPCGAVRFPNLPVLGLPLGSMPPEELRVFARRSSYPEAAVRWLQGIDWCAAQGVHVINMSLGPSLLVPFESSDNDPDPLYAAIRHVVEHGHLVCVAAGNRGPQEDSMQFLARAPWVISVGATGPDYKLLETSSRGSPTAPGPTVVADGTPADPDDKFHESATSFAAPKVSKIVAWLRWLLDVIREDVRQAASDSRPVTIPLRVPIVGYLDTGIRPDVYDAIRTARDTSVSGTSHRHQWYRAVTRLLERNYGVRMRIENNYAGVRRALEAIAQPLPEHKPYEVGAGFVSLELLLGAVRSLTPERWIQMFASDPSSAREIPRAELDAMNASYGPLWDETWALVLTSHIEAGPGRYIVRVA